MFNLIVSGSIWQTHRDSFGSSPVLEYTETAVVQRFMPNKVLDIDAASKLPTLFMSETQGAGMLPQKIEFQQTPRTRPLETLDKSRQLRLNLFP